MNRTQNIVSIAISILLFLSIPQLSYTQEGNLEKVETLQQQVINLYGQGRYSEAIPIAKEVLSIREKAFGPEHPDVASSLNYLALLYYYLGDYAKAEPLFKRSLHIYEKNLGPEDPNVANILNNLALLYTALGDYAKAEPLYQRSLTIREKAFGSEHPLVAANLDNLAELYIAIEDYSKAEQLLQRSLAIREKALGQNHPDVAISLQYLAITYQYSANYTKAESLLQRSLAIRIKALGPENFLVASSLDSLAVLYRDLGDYAKAKSLLQRSLAINEKALGTENPRVATNLAELAFIYIALGDYAKAKSLNQRSLAILKKTLGSDHPRVAVVLNNLSLLFSALGDFEKAYDFLRQALDIESKSIDQIFRFTSEDQQLKFLAEKKLSLYVFLSLIVQHLSQNHLYRKDALNIWLKRKGIILEAQKRFQEALIYSDNPLVEQTFQDLSMVRTELSILTFSGPGEKSPKYYQKKIAILKAQKEKLETKLSQLSQAFALKQKIANADCAKVASSLPQNTVLLEFARVEMPDFKTLLKEPKLKPAHYLVFVLHAGKGDKVGMIDLGEVNQIDKELTRFKEAIANLKDLKDAMIIQSCRTMYDLLFEPLKNELGNVKDIFISPDGNLNLIPFEILQKSNGKFLIEDYTFNYLAAGRDIIGFGQIKEQGKKALLIGDPDFDLGAEEKDTILKKLDLNSTKKKEITKRSSDLKGFTFSKATRNPKRS